MRFFSFFISFLVVVQVRSELPVYSLCELTGPRIITSARGRVTSPNFPEKYPRNQDCEWQIHSPKGTGMRLRVEALDNKEVFSNGKGDCYDTLRISSGKVGGSFNFIDNNGLCAKEVEELRKTIFEIPNNSDEDVVVAKISFLSDYADENKGFSIYFEALCNKTQTAESGVITSPNYPEKYPNNAECFTEIRAPFGKTIEINFENFKVEDQVACTADYVTISEGPPGQYGSRATTYCQSDIGTVNIDSNIATVKFVSDANFVQSGFQATWKAVAPTTTAPPSTTQQATTLPMKNCSYTNESLECQRWDSITPHKPKYRPDDSNHNYCRNPDNDKMGAWCYTTNEDIRWGYCDLDNCVPPTTTLTPTTSLTTTTTVTTKVTERTSTADSTSNGSIITGVIDGANAIPEKQVGNENESGGTSWAVYIVIPIALIILIVIVIFLVRRRRQRKAGITVNGANVDDTVAFSHELNPDDYMDRPRENTYVEIPFLGEIQPQDDLSRREEHADSCGKNFVRLNNRGSVNSAASSNDSIAIAKETAQRNFSAINRGASTSDANPYSVAEDVESGTRALPTPGTKENVYQSIPGQENNAATSNGSSFSRTPLPPTPFERANSKEFQTKQESEKKKGKGWKLNFSSKKNEPVATEGFANPSYREKDVPQQKSFDSDENPFDTDDEAATKTPPVMPRKKRSTIESHDEENSVYNAPSVIPSPPVYETTKDLSASSTTTSGIESPYMMPKSSSSSKPPTNADMVCISPDVIDDDEQKQAIDSNFSLYSSPSATSPVFDMPENFIYDAPSRPAATSISSKSDSDASGTGEISQGSSKSGRDSGNASMLAIESIGEQSHGEYCIMNSAPRRKNYKSESHDKSAPDEINENRLSQVYLPMKGIKGNRRVSETTSKHTQKQKTKPRKSV